MMKTKSKWALGALLAAIGGYLAGILTAPKSGKQTRSDIKNTAAKGISEAEDQLKKASEELASVINKAKSVASTTKGKVRSDLTEVLAEANDVKDKSKALLAAVKKGTADDRDLQKAIKEAAKAIAHLKKFYTK